MRGREEKKKVREKERGGENDHSKRGLCRAID